MSRQSVAKPGVFCRNRVLLDRYGVGNSGEALCRNIIFLCRDRVYMAKCEDFLSR